MKTESKMMAFFKGNSVVLGVIALLVTIVIVLSVLFVWDDDSTANNNTSSLRSSSGSLFDTPPSGSGSSSLSSSSGSTSSSTIDLNDVLGVSSNPVSSRPSTSSGVSSKPSGPKIYTSNNPKYIWPVISPLSPSAGKAFNLKHNIAEASGSLKYVAVESINNKTVPFNVACHIENNKITALLPTGTDLRSIKLSFSCAGTVLYNNKSISSGAVAIDCSIPQKISVVADNKTTDYTVYLMTLETGIPSVSVTTAGYIDITNNEIVKKSTFTNCSVTVGGGDSSICYYADSTPLTSNATIKGRGESSWKENSTNKKSFNLSYLTAQNVLGMGTYKDWALVSNYFDRTLLRNSVGAYLSESLGLPYTMKVRPVDLWLNGVYYGNYSIIERIAVDGGPVKITSGTASTDAEKIGYLLEADHYISNRDQKTWKPYGSAFYDASAAFKDIFFTTTDSNQADKIYFSVTSPALPTQPQANYIYDYMMKVDSAIESKNASQVSSLIDLNSLARWYLTEETMANVGSGFFTSCFMYKDVGKKLCFGPAWDFDLSTGNCDTKYDGVASASDPYLKDRRWFKDLLQLPVFKSEIKKVWNEKKANLASLPSFIDNTVKMTGKSIDFNYKTWPFSDSSDPSNAGRIYEPSAIKSISTYSGQVAYLKSFLTVRIAAMNTTIIAY